MYGRNGLLGAAIGLTLAVAGCTTSPPPADLVLLNGKVVTVDEALPEAQAVAVTGDRITAVGNNDHIRQYAGEGTRIIDLQGRLAIPGLIEGHGHFLGIGAAKMNLDLMGTGSWEEIVSKVEAAVAQAEPGAWILGRGWHQDKWTSTPKPSVDGVPLHHSLSAVSPANPVLLTHASGHSSVANAKALELGGIDRNTPNPEGGEIVRDRQGNATGLLRETAQRLLSGAYARSRAGRTPDQVEAELRRQAELAAQECIARGITSFQDAGSSYQAVDLFKKMADEGSLPLRLWVMLREDNASLAEKLPQYRLIGYGGNRLTVRAIKRSIDGALGSHGAWLLEPYADLPSSSGLNTYPLDQLAETARLAIAHDFQLCVHAIGDRGNRETLDVFEKTFAAHPDKANLRWRVEHAQHVHPADLPRFQELGVIASMQGIHCTSDAPWVPQRLGLERAQEESYLWKTLMRSGAVVTNGTDAPVENVDPIASYYASVSRKLKDGSVFMPEERMTRMEALQSYTINNAYAAFEEQLKGSLGVGKLADITVLDRDILSVPENEIPEAQVDITIVGGKLAYQRR